MPCIYKNENSRDFCLLSLILYCFVFYSSFLYNLKILWKWILWKYLIYKWKAIWYKYVWRHSDDTLYKLCLGDGLSHTELRSQKGINKEVWSFNSFTNIHVNASSSRLLKENTVFLCNLYFELTFKLFVTCCYWCDKEERISTVLTVKQNQK